MAGAMLPGAVHCNTSGIGVAAHGDGLQRLSLSNRHRMMREGIFIMYHTGGGRRDPPDTVPRGGRHLPPLPYPYDALEPVLSAQALYIHHRVHHASYVQGLNRAELSVSAAVQEGNDALVRHWERELAFHGSGHTLHSLYWRNMTPDTVQVPDLLQSVVTRDYGGLTVFRRHYLAAAEQIAGDGWAVWVWQPQYGRSEILAAERHENMVQWGSKPLLVVDAWEHAHYLDYPGRRAEYLRAWWNLVDWRRVQARLHPHVGV